MQAGASAKRAENQLARWRREIKAGPVDIGQLAVNKCGEVAGVRDEIALAVEQRAHLLLEAVVKLGRVHGSYGFWL